MDFRCVAQNIITCIMPGPISTKKAQTSYVLLNPNLEFNLYKNLQSHIQFCFKSSIVFKVCSHPLQLRLPVTFSI